jgi:hypothetical protein
VNALTERQVEFFRREGYLMVPDVFAPADLEPLRDEFTEVIHQTAVELQAAAKLSRLYEEEPFERRLSRIYAETDEILGPIVGRGGVLLLTNVTPHCSTPNRTDVVRWSLDLRYQHAAVPNNIDEAPQEFTWDRPDAEIACYPPESVVRSAAEFNQIRQRYKRSSPPSPDRGWIPYDQRPGAS